MVRPRARIIESDSISDGVPGRHALAPRPDRTVHGDKAGAGLPASSTSSTSVLSLKSDAEFG